MTFIGLSILVLAFVLFLTVSDILGGLRGIANAIHELARALDSQETK